MEVIVSRGVVIGSLLMEELECLETLFSGNGCVGLDSMVKMEAMGA